MALQSKKIASITSSPSPLSGQKHRSSSNFGTDVLPPNTINFEWKVVSADADNIKFDVMKDVSAGIDPVIFSGVVDDKITDVYQNRSLYIANPSGTKNDFLVEVYALYK